MTVWSTTLPKIYFEFDYFVVASIRETTNIFSPKSGMDPIFAGAITGEIGGHNKEFYGRTMPHSSHYPSWLTLSDGQCGWKLQVRLYPNGEWFQQGRLSSYENIFDLLFFDKDQNTISPDSRELWTIAIGFHRRIISRYVYSRLFIWGSRISWSNVVIGMTWFHGRIVPKYQIFYIFGCLMAPWNISLKN